MLKVSNFIVNSVFLKNHTIVHISAKELIECVDFKLIGVSFM